MGKLAKVMKDRVCLVCEEILRTDSSGLKEHARMCAIAKRMGLVLPTIVRPKLRIRQI